METQFTSVSQNRNESNGDGRIGKREDKEGPVAKAIEEQTAKLPSDTFLWLAGGSIAISLALKLMGKSHTALFVGQWAPTFLLLGTYNKVVKVAGHDRYDRQVG